jgi:uroporphyrinogen decarboxylase
MIKTGADIVDIDHLVLSMAPFASLPGPGQVFCGNSDPVAVIQNGTEEAIRQHVRRSGRETGGRCIVSAGCEVPPGTSLANMKIFADTAGSADVQRRHGGTELFTAG